MKTDQMEHDVARRLRAVMAEFGLSSYEELAELCGSNKAAVGQWMLGNNLPPVRKMIELGRRTGITLDWVYDGKLGSLPSGLAIRLAAILEGMEPPAVPRALEPELAPPAPKAAAPRPARVKRATAT